MLTGVGYQAQRWTSGVVALLAALPRGAHEGRPDAIRFTSRQPFAAAALQAGLSFE